MIKKRKKTVIITAGSKGIGLSITNYFIKKKFNVVVVSRKSSKRFKSTNSILSLDLDLTKEDSYETLATLTLKKFKSIDIIINNFGISEWKSINKIDKNFIDRILLSNFYSTVWGAKYASKYMKRGSVIINISSIAGKRGSANNSIYSASKFAINGFTQSLAKELGKKGIRVNAICPVLIKTDGLLKALKEKESPAYKNINLFFKKFIDDNSALNKLPVSQDVAELCYFLSSDSSKSITGQCINLDSGVFPQ